MVIVVPKGAGGEYQYTGMGFSMRGCHITRERRDRRCHCVGYEAGHREGREGQNEGSGWWGFTKGEEGIINAVFID